MVKKCGKITPIFPHDSLHFEIPFSGLPMRRFSRHAYSFFSLAALTAALPTAGQEQWIQLPSPTTSTMYAIDFPDSATGYMVGESGRIFKTTDAANSWTAQISGVSHTLRSVKFTSASDGVIVGDQGLILRTTNGGASWSPQPSGTSERLNALTFHATFDGHKGYAVGDRGVILQSTDGGATWGRLVSMVQSNLYAVQMNGFLGFATGEPMETESGISTTFLSANPNGVLWVPIYNTQDIGTVYALSAPASHMIFVANDSGVVSRTRDKGSSWELCSPSNLDIPPGRPTLYFLNPETGYMMTSGSLVAKTTDGGQSWVGQSTPVPAVFRAMTFTNASTGYLVAEGGKIFKHIFPPPTTPPSPTSPLHGAQNVALSTSLGWDTTPYTATYRVQVATDADFSNIIFEDSTLLSSTAFVEGLDMLTTYHWRVSARNPGGASNWSDVRSFTTVPPRPNAPALTTPLAGAVHTVASPTMAWNAAPDAVTYRLQVSADYGFTAIVMDTTQTTTSNIAGPLTNNTAYYWRVNAANPQGTSDWSEVRIFITAPVPEPPVAFSPAPGALIENVPSTTLEWTASAHALTYRVQLSTDATFATTVVNDSMVTGTTRAVGPLAYSTTYYWRVNAKNGGTSAYSAAANFTTLRAPPATPVLSQPAASALNVSLSTTLTWEADTAAATYHVQLSTDSAFATALLNDSTLTDTSRTVSSLATGTTYYWRVRARNAGGASASSATRSFTTLPSLPPVPDLSAPADNAVNVAVSTSVSWLAAEGATTYTVELGLGPTFATTLINDSTVSGTSREVSGLLNATTYYWRVSARNAAGASPHSPTRRFTTAALATPSLTTPAANAANVAARSTFAWSAVGDATGYTVQVSAASDFSTFVVNAAAATTSLQIGPLTAGATYYWRVRARNAGSDGAFSAHSAFSVMALPAVPTLTSPQPDSTQTPTTLALTWGSVAGAATYHLQVSTDSLFATALVNDSTLTTPTLTVGPLSEGTSYYWRVSAKNAGGTSAYSPVRRFTTFTPTSLAWARLTYQGPGITANASVHYQLPDARKVRVRLHKVRGEQVADLLNEARAAGAHELQMPTGLSQGIYMLEFRAGDYRQLLKLVR